MTHLARLLDQSTDLLAPLKVRAPDMILLRRAVERIDGISRDIAQEDTAALQLRIGDLALGAGQGPFTRRDLRESCKTYLHPPSPPGRRPEVGSVLLDEVVRSQLRSAMFALLDAYLDGFDAADEDVERLAKRLGAMSRGWAWRTTDTWADRVARYDLLSPKAAPRKLGSAVMESDAPPVTILDDAGLTTEGRRVGGLALAAFVWACGSVANAKGDAAIPSQCRLMSWAGPPGKLAYPKAWPNYADALFTPWRSSEPERAHKALVIEQALAFAGDPRINQGRWRLVRDTAEDAYDTIMRWLTRAAVEQFFDIVSETMTDRPDMWAERRAFWTKYLRADRINQAWVAFGGDGARRADRAARLTSDKSLTMFGRLASGGGRSAQHAALIMRIGDLTVVDWSHNGKWNIWRKGDPHHPILFRQNSKQLPDYDPGELMYAPLSGPHMSNWDLKVAQIIKNETGIRP